MIRPLCDFALSRLELPWSTKRWLGPRALMRRGEGQERVLRLVRVRATEGVRPSAVGQGRVPEDAGQAWEEWSRHGILRFWGCDFAIRMRTVTRPKGERVIGRCRSRGGAVCRVCLEGCCGCGHLTMPIGQSRAEIKVRVRHRHADAGADRSEEASSGHRGKKRNEGGTPG